MKNVLNQALFRHRGSATEGFNNLCIIIHQLRDEGTYFGEVQRAKQSVGSFTLRFDKKLPSHEVHVDAAKFDQLFNRGSRAQPVERSFEVGGEGYVILYTSGAHTDLRIKLHRRDEKNVEVVYDTARLTSGDMVVFRLLVPGTYRIGHAKEKHIMTLAVRSPDGGKYPATLGKLPPIHAKLTQRGFEPAKVDPWPLQALIIQVDVPGALRADLIEVAAEKSA
jgi:hypothetical protein